LEKCVNRGVARNLIRREAKKGVWSKFLAKSWGRPLVTDWRQSPKKQETRAKYSTKQCDKPQMSQNPHS